MLDLPYRSIANKRLLVHLVGSEGHRPPLPPDGHCHDAWRKLMVACWAGKGTDRPPFKDILKMLRPLLPLVTEWAPTVDEYGADHASHVAAMAVAEAVAVAVVDSK